MMLRLSGHEVRTAYNGPSALADAASAPPDAVLLDIGLPDMDGFEIAHRLRQKDGLSQTVIIAVTGYGQDADRRRTKEAGFDYHLVKPIDSAQLEQVLSGLLRDGVRS